MKLENLFSNRNIIIALAVLFAGWVVFLDRNNWLDSQQIDQRILELETERDFYQSKISQDSLVIEGLKDSAFTEAFARENFFMKRPGETMFLIKNVD